MSQDGSAVRPLTAAAGGNQDPTISADGKTIAYASSRDGASHIYTLELGNGRETVVSLVRGKHEQMPRFFPNGDLAYIVERDDGQSPTQIVRAAAGQPPVPLVGGDRRVGSFAVSRDGKRIAYVLIRDVNREKGMMESSLFVLQPGSDASPISIPLTPGERVVSLSF
jgi:Tol biopolymer transport system component